MKNILVLAPHTDDGELGCGGTLAILRDHNLWTCRAKQVVEKNK